MTDAARPLYPRILLKLSGEALMGTGEYGLDAGTVTRLAAEVRSVISLGIQVCLVIGGGVRMPATNLFLLEALINLVRTASPATAIGFNTTPLNSADAVDRVLT